MTTTIVTHAIAVLVGGAVVWAWYKYKAKAAADLANLGKKL